MQAKYISYRETHAFSSVVLDYIGGKTELRPFYQYTPDYAGFAEAIAQRNFKGNRIILRDALLAQYTGVEAPDVVLRNVHSLAEENTFTITTGHQLNIFTGPLYFIYKIVTAINLAKELKQQFPDRNFVPVYWMATEDHDFEEINHVKVEERKLSWDKKSAGATGQLLTNDFTEVLLAYKGYLGITENGLELAKIMEDAYGAERKLSDATRILVNALFGKYGLVCIDADERSLKQQFSGIIQKDITEENSFRQISDTDAALEQLGYKTQVNPREINFFYMTNGLRERIVKEAGQYAVLNTDIRFSEGELNEEISAFPERFSPNVVMRPMYQELILPNLAYIGGGAETTYWLQLKTSFDHYGVAFPVLILRNSAQIIDKRSEQRMHILGIKHTDIFTPTDSLKSQWVKAHVPLRFALEDEQRAISFIFEQIKLTAYKIDKTLSVSADAAKTRTFKLIATLEKKLLRAEKRKHVTSLAQIDSLKEKLFPAGVLQERVLNIAPMYVLYGPEFIEALIKSFKPLDHEFTVLFA